LGWFGFQETVDALFVHEVDAYEAGKGERAFDCGLCFLCQVQEQIGDQGHGYLDAHGILAAAHEMLDLQGLLDPFKKQLNGPAV
jgi:hypothetical protein